MPDSIGIALFFIARLFFKSGLASSRLTVLAERHLGQLKDARITAEEKASALFMVGDNVADNNSYALMPHEERLPL